MIIIIGIIVRRRKRRIYSRVKDKSSSDRVFKCQIQ